MQVEWISCATKMPPRDYPVWCSNFEQLWGMATLTDGTDCHSEDYWWLEAQQHSLTQMFVTHWAEVEWPEPPQKEGG